MPGPAIADRRAAFEGLFVLGAISQYAGAAVAVELFDEIEPPAVALLRVLAAGVLITAFRRSWRRRWTVTELRWAAAFGIALAGMNLSIYMAFDRLPLGTAVAIEFMGPITVAALGVRTARSAIALAIAVAGVMLLAGVQPAGSAAGVGFALVAATMWAGYIVLGHRVARMGAAVDGLGVGMLCGAAVISVFGVPELGPAGDRPWLLVLALATAVLSSAIPYAIDQVVLQRLDRARFALLQALLPVVAVVVGLVALSQEPSTGELAGVALVIVALVLQPRPLPSSDTVLTPTS